MKAKRDSFYAIGDTSFILYVDRKFNVGFGLHSEEAMRSAGKHNHWLKDGNSFNDNVKLISSGNMVMENK